MFKYDNSKKSGTSKDKSGNKKEKDGHSKKLGNLGKETPKHDAITKEKESKTKSSFLPKGKKAK